MTTVKIRDGDSFESAIRKFKRLIDKTRVLQELRLREFHLSGSVLKQRQKAAAKKRWAKKLARDKYNFRETAKTGNHPLANKSNFRERTYGNSGYRNNFKTMNNA